MSQEVLCYYLLRNELPVLTLVCKYEKLDLSSLSQICTCSNFLYLCNKNKVKINNLNFQGNTSLKTSKFKGK